MAASCPYAEIPARAEAILAALGADRAAGRPWRGAAAARSTRQAYLAFLKSAHADWRAAGRAGRRRAAMPGRWCGRRPLDLDRIDARLGRYSFDASSPIAAGHLGGRLLVGADARSSALDAVLAGERAAFALCRPPGHHAGADYLGGYCYLNNAAIAAEAAVAAGPARSRSSTSTIITATARRTSSTPAATCCSSRSTPIRATDYPYLLGPCRRDRRGRGRGRDAQPAAAARHRSRPPICRRSTGRWTRIAGFAPDLLVCSLRRRHLRRRPDLASSRSRRRDYAAHRRAGSPRSACRPLIVMEGGYAVDALGANVAAFLSGF